MKAYNAEDVLASLSTFPTEAFSQTRNGHRTVSSRDEFVIASSLSLTVTPDSEKQATMRLIAYVIITIRYAKNQWSPKSNQAIFGT